MELLFETEQICLESNSFPFNMFDGNGFSASDADMLSFHNHNCLELNYITAGQGIYYIGDAEYSLKKGDFLIINNCEYHVAKNIKDLNMKVIVFHPDMVWRGQSTLDYNYLKTFFEWKDNFKHHFSCEDIVIEEVVILFYQIEREWQQQREGYRLMIKALLMQVLALLYRIFEASECSSQRVLAFQNDYNRIFKSIQYLDEKFTESISLETLAALVHMSPSHFSHYFKRVMSATVSEYIMKKRMHHAVLLLTTTKICVSEIALSSGFSNISNFNRAFKKYYGVSPTKFCKRE